MNTDYFERVNLRPLVIIRHLIIAGFLVSCGGGGSTTKASINQVPVANAGNDLSVITGNQVTLDSSASTDADNDSLTYQWVLLSFPTGSTAFLNDSASVTPIFTADVDGNYVVSLVVNDGTVDSVSDSVIVTSSTSGSNSYSYPVVDTSQSHCYNSSTGSSETCSGVGFDADYSGNQPSYTLSTDGLTVTDNVTNLVWTQSTDINSDGVVDYDDKLSQSDAVNYCSNLSLGGRVDWRLPDIKEAYSLILFNGEDASAYSGTDTSGLVLFLNDNYFDRAFGDPGSTIPIMADRLIDAQYASTTLYTSTTMSGDASMFGVNYVDGRIKGYPTLTKDYYVRCVTGNTSYGINDFVDNSDATISDQATGLMWQQDDAESTDWDDAISQCEASTTASYSDWRLPNVKELQSILDYSRSPDINNSAAIDAVFNASSFTNEEGVTDWGYYWASTTHVGYSGDGRNATYVSFGRALGYMNGSILDVHGAGSQRSNDKLDVSSEPGANSAIDANGLFYYKGPQGDILRDNNKIRCVRDIDTTTSTSAQPNILLIISDDLGLDASAQHALSSDLPDTPNLNALADNGIVFDNVWATPACTTTRANIITGKYGVHSGVDFVPDILPATELTIQAALKADPKTSNYQSAVFGKWHLGGGNSELTHPNDSGIDHYEGNIDGILTDYSAWNIVVNGEEEPVLNYHTTEITDRAISWANQQTQPWFMWVAYVAPHSPFHLPPGNTELSGTTDDILNNPRQYYLAAIEYMDQEIGRLLSELSEEDRDNTVIIYVGDNGTPKAVIDQSVYPKAHGKGSLYEGSLRVPMIISGIGVSQVATVDNTLINTVDLYPTIANLAGSTSITTSDSQSFSGLLNNTAVTTRDYNYSEFISLDVTGHTVRNSDYKLINYDDGSQELYRISSSIKEVNNLLPGTVGITDIVNELNAEAIRIRN